LNFLNENENDKEEKYNNANTNCSFYFYIIIPFYPCTMCRAHSEPTRTQRKKIRNENKNICNLYSIFNISTSSSSAQKHQHENEKNLNNDNNGNKIVIDRKQRNKKKYF
jgi:hypothetical protein